MWNTQYRVKNPHMNINPQYGICIDEDGKSILFNKNIETFDLFCWEIKIEANCVFFNAFDANVWLNDRSNDSWTWSLKFRSKSFSISFWSIIISFFVSFSVLFWWYNLTMMFLNLIKLYNISILHISPFILKRLNKSVHLFNRSVVP